MEYKVVFPDEKRASNVRGVSGKMPLNSLKVAEKDMWNAVDVVCRKTKTVAATETENIC